MKWTALRVAKRADLHDRMTPFDRRTTGKHGIRCPHIQMTDVFIDFL